MTTTASTLATTTQSTAATPGTVPAITTCTDVADGAARVTNSWTCRSCLQYFVNFNMDQTVAASDMQLEIWFSNHVKLTFSPNHQWPQGLVQFDGHLLFDPSDTAVEVISVRLCTSSAVGASTGTSGTTGTGTTGT